MLLEQPVVAERGLELLGRGLGAGGLRVVETAVVGVRVLAALVKWLNEGEGKR